MKKKPVLRLAVPAVLLLLCAAVPLRAQDGPTVGVLRFSAHKSASGMWDDRTFERLQHIIIKKIQEKNISALPAQDIKTPEALFSSADGMKAIEEVWTDMRRMEGAEYLLAGSVESHKGGGNSLSLMLLRPADKSVIKLEPVSFQGGEDRRSRPDMRQLIEQILARVDEAMQKQALQR